MKKLLDALRIDNSAPPPGNSEASSRLNTYPTHLWTKHSLDSPTTPLFAYMNQARLPIPRKAASLLHDTFPAAPIP